MNQCVKLKETANAEVPLYAKIGCQHRDTYTSTKLQLIVYKDKQCSQIYSEDEMKGDGYDLDGYFLSNKVSGLALLYFSFLDVVSWKCGRQQRRREMDLIIITTVDLIQ